MSSDNSPSQSTRTIAAPRQSSKAASVTLLALAEVAGMSLWFASAAILPDMVRESGIGTVRQAMLSSGVQLGFVAGALAVAASGLADRFDPRRVLALSAVLAALCNAALLIAPVGGNSAILLRVLTGLLLAGVYPVGMKIAVGWGTSDRGLLVGLLVGALTIGSALPHFAAFLGGADWRGVIVATSALAFGGGLLVLLCSLGPHHAGAPRFSTRAIALAWGNRRIRLTYLGYFGHMWELYAMWAWVGVAAAASYGPALGQDEATHLAKLTAFLAIALGGLTCAPAGWLADRIGKAEVTIIAMALSGSAAIATALSFGGPIWLTFLLIVIWGIFVVPDSAQFSALVADASPPDLAGSVMTLQTALGFALTAVTVQVTPLLAQTFGWPAILAGLAIGPAAGIAAMSRLLKI